MLFSSGEDVRVIEADGGTVKKTSLIDGDVNDVQAGRCQNLIHFRGADGPNMVERVGLIGAIKELGSFVGATIQRLILPKREIYATEAKTLLISEVQVNCDGVLALILRVLRREKPVLVTVDRCSQIGQRIGVENTQAVGASG